MSDKYFSTTYNEAKRLAIRHLPGASFKILEYLVSRADSIGTSFPAVATIAEECGFVDSTAYKHLDILEQCGYIIYLRRNERDLLTGKPVPNVYMVSPSYFAPMPQERSRADSVWQKYQGKALLNPLKAKGLEGSEWSDDSAQPNTNHHQKNQTRTTYREQPSRTHHHQQTSTAFETSDAVPDDDTTPDWRRGNFDSDDIDRLLNKHEQQQRSTNSQSSAPRAPYRTPEPVHEPLPDELQENLAHMVNAIRIPLAMARGMISLYGWSAVDSALSHVNSLPRDQVQNRAGLLRHLLDREFIQGYTS